MDVDSSWNSACDEQWWNCVNSGDKSDSGNDNNVVMMLEMRISTITIKI